jgi:lipoprotein NlpI
MQIPDRDELSANASEIDANIWPGPIVAMYVGRATVDQVEFAAAHGDSGTNAQRQCEASFYSGEYQLLAGRPDQAKENLKLAASDCPSNYYERAAASGELNELQRAGSNTSP